MTRPRPKGKRGELEVVQLWRQAGWTGAFRTPNSGGLRPFGAGDLSPWPGDIGGIKPWLCEVKYDERVKAPSRGWTGEAFIRRTLKDLDHLAIRHSFIVGATRPRPVLFARGSFEFWRVFVPEHELRPWIGDDFHGFVEPVYVELTPPMFFELAHELEPVP